MYAPVRHNNVEARLPIGPLPHYWYRASEPTASLPCSCDVCPEVYSPEKKCLVCIERIQRSLTSKSIQLINSGYSNKSNLLYWLPQEKLSLLRAFTTCLRKKPQGFLGRLLCLKILKNILSEFDLWQSKPWTENAGETEIASFWIYFRAFHLHILN